MKRACTNAHALFSILCRSKPGLLVSAGFSANLSTSTCTASGVRNAGSTGPRRMFFTPSESSVSRTASAFCSNQEMSRDSGRLLTSVFNALASSVATTRAE